jgi:ribosomal protein S18 acetylase RimI-like enzyme
VDFKDELAHHRLAVRPIAPQDEAFLYRVYASTRAEEMALTGWNDVQRESFLRMQFALQHGQYQQSYPNGTFDVLLRDEESVGRLYVDRGADEILIIDIALLPEARGGGAGSVILRALQNEGSRTSRRVALYVEHFNPAQHLYRRMGFVPVDQGEVYLLMHWTPPGV